MNVAQFGASVVTTFEYVDAVSICEIRAPELILEDMH